MYVHVYIHVCLNTYVVVPVTYRVYFSCFHGQSQFHVRGVFTGRRGSELADSADAVTDALTASGSTPMELPLSLGATSSPADVTHTPPERDTGLVTLAARSQPTDDVTGTQVTATDDAAVDTAVTDASAADASTADVTSSAAAAAARRGSSMAFTIDFGGDGRGKDVESPAAAPTAFTVDFSGGGGGGGGASAGSGGEEKRAKKMSMNDSLSQFLPSKVRKSFRERGARGKRDDSGHDEVRVRSLARAHNHPCACP